MYAQIFLVTSVRGAFLTPQIFARASDRVFGAKMPFPDFFMAAARRLPLAFFAVLPRAFFVVLMVAFLVLVVATVVFLVVVVIAIEGCKCTQAL